MIKYWQGAPTKEPIEPLLHRPPKYIKKYLNSHEIGFNLFVLLTNVQHITYMCRDVTKGTLHRKSEN